MKSKWTVIMVMLAAVVLTGCRGTGALKGGGTGSSGVNAAAADRASNGSLTRRTWVIHMTSMEPHMRAGHAFRIRKEVGKHKLIPLRALKDDWFVLADDFSVDLDVYGDDDSILCGKVDIPGHKVKEETHVIVIKTAGIGTSDNNIIVYIDALNPHKDMDTQCTSLRVHQGRAHAEN